MLVLRRTKRLRAMMLWSYIALPPPRLGPVLQPLFLPALYFASLDSTRPRSFLFLFLQRSLFSQDLSSCVGVRELFCLPCHPSPC